MKLPIRSLHSFHRSQNKIRITENGRGDLSDGGRRQRKGRPKLILCLNCRPRLSTHRTESTQPPGVSDSDTTTRSNKIDVGTVYRVLVTSDGLGRHGSAIHRALCRKSPDQQSCGCVCPPLQRRIEQRQWQYELQAFPLTKGIMERVASVAVLSISYTGGLWKWVETGSTQYESSWSSTTLHVMY
ncbi:hypothetical protein BU24DRAFT_231928 [Aaosphaeria arxii CBS 175.79]|uniref:Uncharacterized protein n=1 Tax=Aaosphaeria arxii CBS 175.79 TaxID=1450172 RepID=A0A6A5XLL5_9PLEO|nr:uncharacterized protein BU24DRAFT_231928 [Aaosphaeria arxii CBS 175.79]KAF2013194.1 hypothetical protein BU24DRAFT_231928 [Aaosphaeria arxii CBS 175.79]